MLWSDAIYNEHEHFCLGQPVYNFIMLSLEETASQQNLEVANRLGEEEVNDKWRSSATSVRL